MEDTIEDVKNHIRNNVAYPVEPLIKNCDSRIGHDGTLEMWLTTSLTGDEMERIEEEYPIVEIYGFDAEHFDGIPKAREQLGLIVSVE